MSTEKTADARQEGGADIPKHHGSTLTIQGPPFRPSQWTMFFNQIPVVMSALGRLPSGEIKSAGMVPAPDCGSICIALPSGAEVELIPGTLLEAVTSFDPAVRPRRNKFPEIDARAVMVFIAIRSQFQHLGITATDMKVSDWTGTGVREVRAARKRAPSIIPPWVRHTITCRAETGLPTQISWISTPRQRSDGAWVADNAWTWVKGNRKIRRGPLVLDMPLEPSNRASQLIQRILRQKNGGGY